MVALMISLTSEMVSNLVLYIFLGGMEATCISFYSRRRLEGRRKEGDE